MVNKVPGMRTNEGSQVTPGGETEAGEEKTLERGRKRRRHRGKKRWREIKNTEG